MLTNQYLFERYHLLSTMDVARMGSYVLGGIGFLGAGAACTFTVLTLWVLKIMEGKMFGRGGTVFIEMEIRNQPGQLAAVLSPLVELGCAVRTCSSSTARSNGSACRSS
jgi:hypothetical protein